MPLSAPPTSQCFGTGKRGTTVAQPQTGPGAVTALPTLPTAPDYRDRQVTQCSHRTVLVFSSGLKTGAISSVTKEWEKANFLSSGKSNPPTEVTRGFTKDGQKGEEEEDGSKTKVVKDPSRSQEQSGAAGPQQDP